MIRKAPLVAEPSGFIMTPMIDVVFQLLVFFMLVLDMSSQRIEDLALPEASEARRSDNPDTVVVNVKTDGAVRVNGKVYTEAALERFFRDRRSIPDYQWHPILIRADRSADWIHVQKVMTVASRYGGIVRVEFGARLAQEVR